MSKELLQAIIDQGVNRESLNSFFSVSNNYSEKETPLSAPTDPRFSNLEMLGEIIFSPTQKLAMALASVNDNLSERSSKKAQYETAKRVLKELQKYDAGIFVFYDNSGCFRFSLVYAQYTGPKIIFSSFRRFTYFVDPKKTNKTFKDRVGGCSFTSLDALKDAFSVEKVNKEFYKQIAQYYYMLTGKEGKPRQLVLPSVAVDDDKKYEEFAVRLIGRSVFCWFLKHKTSSAGLALIPEELLSVAAVKPTYYHFILEPLFFEVMNTEIKKRKPEVLSALPKSKDVPFLNGGLFEPHVHDYFPGAANFGLKIPDTWFKDFFGLLEQYNFTIDENSTVDAEVSVDPEMMGRIFENLLAEVNPETGETARKATGSYYTPRVIVDYMVEQSLKQYLLKKSELDEDKITSLLSYEDDINGWMDEQKESVVKAFKEIKIIDPACGSGAFPMGILHRMLLALEKVDPKLEIWRREFLKSLDDIVKQTVEKNIRKENWAYIRKLMIVRDSIYGVDIQPIAVEIAKLRCFLSLVVDEIVSDQEENRGIEPLPNLEFKFVAANSLIGLPSKHLNLGDFSTIDAVKQLRLLREKYLRSYGDEKNIIESEFRKTQAKLRESIEWAIPASQINQLATWDPFSYKAVGWFDSEWMFGIAGGFDVVIANPPYGFRNVLSKDEKVYFRKVENIAFSSGDSAELFSKKSFDKLVKNNGILTFIIPKKSLYGDAWDGFRKDYWAKNKLTFLLDVSKAFDDVLFEESAFGMVKADEHTELQLCYLTKLDMIYEFAKTTKNAIFMDNNTVQMYKVLFPDSLFKKIQTQSTKDKLVSGELGLAIGVDSQVNFPLL